MIDRKFPQEHTEKVTPANNDWIPLTDSADGDNLKKIKYSNLKGTKGDPISWKGTYNAGTAYAVNDAVSYNGVSYICILASTGNLPTNVTYWAVMVQVSSATDTGQGAVRLADAAQSIAGTDTEASEPLVPQPSHVKAVRDIVTAEALKIKSKEDVVCATTANITLSGAQTIDGISAVAGNRVLVKDQSTASQNGIYVVAAGAWTRATDFDSNVNNEVDLGAEVWVSSGTVNGGRRYALTTTGAITVGSTSLTFAQTYPIAVVDASCRVTKTTTQTVGAGYTALTWDSETYDTHTMHDNVTNNSRITIAAGQGGKYLIVANVNSSSTTAYNCKLVLNGSTDIAKQNGNYVSGTDGGCTVSTIYSLSAGDYVEAHAANSVTVIAASFFAVQKIA